MRHSASLLAILAVAILLGAPAYADLDNLDIGGDLMMMGYWSDNTYSLDDDCDDEDSFRRMEGHIWFLACLAENVEAKISLEFDRTFSNEDGVRGVSCSNWGSPMSDGYYEGDDDLGIFLEEAYIKMADVYGYPVTVTLGRQFIELGDGFVLGDSLAGDPTDISDLGIDEIDPFDALKIEWEASEDWLVTLIWSKFAETRTLREDTDLYVLNVSYLGFENHIVEGYYMFFDVDGCGCDYYYSKADNGYGDVQVKLHQIGLRAEGRIVDQLGYHAEATWQFADSIETSYDCDKLASDGDLDIGGWAIEAGLLWEPEAMADNNVGIGFTITWMSGVDYDDESDYDGYIQIADSRTFGEIADFYGMVSNNISSCGVGPYPGVFIFNLDAKADLTEQLSGALEAYYFMADEDEWLNDKDDIGWEVDAYLNYEITEDLSAQVAAGIFEGGDASEEYFGADDTAWFFRGGVTVSF